MVPAPFHPKLQGIARFVNLLRYLLSLTQGMCLFCQTQTQCVWQIPANHLCTYAYVPQIARTALFADQLALSLCLFSHVLEPFSCQQHPWSSEITNRFALLNGMLVNVRAKMCGHSCTSLVGYDRLFLFRLRATDSCTVIPGTDTSKL